MMISGIELHRESNLFCSIPTVKAVVRDEDSNTFEVGTGWRGKV